MTLLHILAFCGFALLVGYLLPGRWRGWLLLAASVLAMYWLQPASTIRHLGFWLPTATLALTVLSWAITRGADPVDRRETWTTALVVAAVVCAIAALRYLGPLCCLTQTRPPQWPYVLLAVGLAGGLTTLASRFLARSRWIAGVLFALILLLFLILKTEPWGQAVSAWLRARSGQDTALASPLDLGWLGFSYVAFRLLHTLRDRMTGRLPALTLGEYITYVIFFPAFTAGPIDRVQRFAKDLRSSEHRAAENLIRGGERIVVGVFKKFVLADSLALIALNAENVAQTNAAGHVWLLLYAYSFQIFLDFSGYTDIAIGLGRLLGIKLPENFSRPYLKENLTIFWNSWHITLAQWFRAYFFNPLTRAMRASRVRLPVPLIIVVGQLSTMCLIGLWHGVTWNFLAWGAWHGIGLFIHNRWSDWMRGRLGGRDARPGLQRLGQVVGVLLTFHFVTLGWVWFALPTPAQSLQVFAMLVGN
ncbi:MAG: MBOAT family O-acyltransferase [Anaerolineales bacterium]|jgi:D-alanyl-lipoteichoic acid acyltransferase DltB (MBOAT superfamily)